jgi:hypothetical protein
MKQTQLFGFLLGGLAAVVLLAPAPSSAQCGADPTQSPIGVETKSDAKGPSLSGVLIVEFLDSDGFTSTAARVVARLRRGNQLATFYAQRLDVTPPFNFETPSATQAILTDMLRGPVLGTFFEDVCSADGSLCPDPEECGPDGSLCPEECGPDGSLCTPVGVVLKRLEEFGLTDDLAYRPGPLASQIMVTDVVMSTTEPL